ncbi:c-type cytochrome [Silanimonas sp.]|uniref:c-type cytochrome n=1 Tax=Silanimonas sp. TaxID=1929290 RepID=UPI0022C40AC6|nr:c-type cytochrome [Silanimonas sp.]MCZ8061750.1 c-type cytochrome [Silanimonas sp.]
MKPLLVAAIALGLPAAALAQTSPPAGSPRLPPATAPSPVAVVKPAQLGLCVACHGENGTARQPGTPHLGGQDEAYLVLALNAYRDGSRKAVAMNAISNALQPDDIEAIARWYASQPGFRPPAER